MSFFMNNAANQSVNMQNMAMAEQELEMVSDLFNRYADRYLHCCHCSLHVPFCRCFRSVRENFGQLHTRLEILMPNFMERLSRISVSIGYLRLDLLINYRH